MLSAGGATLLGLEAGIVDTATGLGLDADIVEMLSPCPQSLESLAFVCGSEVEKFSGSLRLFFLVVIEVKLRVCES